MKSELKFGTMNYVLHSLLDISVIWTAEKLKAKFRETAKLKVQSKFEGNPS